MGSAGDSPDVKRSRRCQVSATARAVALEPTCASAEAARTLEGRIEKGRPKKVTAFHDPTHSSRLALLVVAVLVAIPAIAASARAIDDKPVTSDQPMTSAGGGSSQDAPKCWLDDVQDSLFNGKVTADLRLRFEHVHDDTVGPEGRRGQGYAFTERLRLGYGTKPFHGLNLFVEFEDIRATDSSTYNDGVRGPVSEGIIADPEDTELNQAYAKYVRNGFTTIAGRQRITLDDHRFVGNVGWRQNEQTFDALTVKVEPVEKLAAFYGYVNEVNRVFGPDARRDFRSDSHLVNVSYGGLPIGTVAGFAYLLDFGNSPASSSDSFGVRLAGSQEVLDDWSVGYIGSFARQLDGGDHPVDYDANYYNLEASVTRNGWGTIGAGYELLGSDSRRFAFQTPLATLHAFNGWADVFLVTPAAGLEDIYVYAGTTLPWDIQARAIYHRFDPDIGSTDFGQEIDAVVSRAFGKHVTVLAKYADFDGDSGGPFRDVRRFWLQLEMRF
jgi:hypothetical protein